jgi:hypothetical protein
MEELQLKIIEGWSTFAKVQVPSMRAREKKEGPSGGALTLDFDVYTRKLSLRLHM